MQEKSGDWWTEAVVVYLGLVRPPACPSSVVFFNAVLRCVRACLSLSSDVPLLSHLQGVLGPLGPPRRIWLEPADGLVAHGADAANFQPLHQTLFVKRMRTGANP